MVQFLWKRRNVCRNKQLSIQCLSLVLVAGILFIFGFKDLFLKDDSFILDVLAWSHIIGVLLRQEVRRGGQTKLICSAGSCLI